MYYHTEDEWEQTMEVILVEKCVHTPSLPRAKRDGLTDFPLESFSKYF